jgi:hypothetical protein
MSHLDWPPRPAVPAVVEGGTYQYQGRCKEWNDKKVRVISLTWPGSSLPTDAHLVHCVVLGQKGKPTQETFGCDPRWLSDGGLSPYSAYHNDLSRGNKNIREATAKPFGLSDPEEQGDLWQD